MLTFIFFVLDIMKLLLIYFEPENTCKFKIYRILIKEFSDMAVYGFLLLNLVINGRIKLYIKTI